MHARSKAVLAASIASILATFWHACAHWQTPIDYPVRQNVPTLPQRPKDCDVI